MALEARVRMTDRTRVKRTLPGVGLDLQMGTMARPAQGTIRAMGMIRPRGGTRGVGVTKVVTRLRTATVTVRVTKAEADMAIPRIQGTHHP